MCKAVRIRSGKIIAGTWHQFHNPQYYSIPTIFIADPAIALGIGTRNWDRPVTLSLAADRNSRNGNLNDRD
jgi:hypothetical protein